MITKEDLRILLNDLESDRVERTTSKNKVQKFCEAICAFSNDFPNHKLPGYLIIGANDDGSISGLQVDDELLLTLSAHRSNGNILPLPAMAVDKYSFPEGDVAVVEVFPHDLPPVRFKGRIYIRVGPRKAIANEAEERILTERRILANQSFDSRPQLESTLADLDLSLFKLTYLPQAVAEEVIEENHRDIKVQLASLRFYDLKKDCPTHAGILLFGKNPLYFLPGAYIQFVRFNGNDLSSDPVNEYKFEGDMVTMLRALDHFIPTQIVSRPVPKSVLKEERLFEYPYLAVRELLINAVMHRHYNSNAPIRFYWFRDFIEIQNPGGLYGMARPENFPTQNDYRNPVLAEALKNLGYVNRFSRGVIKSQQLLKQNGNPPAEFTLHQATFLSVRIFKKELPNGNGKFLNSLVF